MSLMAAGRPESGPRLPPLPRLGVPPGPSPALLPKGEEEEDGEPG